MARDAVEMVIAPRRRSIGGDEVDRLLPFRSRRTVGPFIYADLIGPESLPPGAGVDVPVHPHIGLATITYLFGGAFVHRDSTGAVQRIEPGGVNWMTAGRGVAHSERSPDDVRAAGSTIAGLQTWVALPDHAEEVEPSFQHVPAADVPTFPLGEGAVVDLVAGTFAGRTSPVHVHSPLVHAVVRFSADGGRITVDAEHPERALLVVGDDGDGATIDGTPVPPRHLAVLREGADVEVLTAGPSYVVVLGGSPVGERFIRWNFVSSSRERIDAAAAAWRAGDWPAVPGDDELVPMPAGA